MKYVKKANENIFLKTERYKKTIRKMITTTLSTLAIQNVSHTKNPKKSPFT